MLPAWVRKVHLRKSVLSFISLRLTGWWELQREHGYRDAVREPVIGYPLLKSMRVWSRTTIGAELLTSVIIVRKRRKREKDCPPLRHTWVASVIPKVRISLEWGKSNLARQRQIAKPQETKSTRLVSVHYFYYSYNYGYYYHYWYHMWVFVSVLFFLTPRDLCRLPMVGLQVLSSVSKWLDSLLPAYLCSRKSMGVSEYSLMVHLLQATTTVVY